jgi:hypothetical protein
MTTIPTTAGTAINSDPRAFIHMSQRELDEMFTAAPPGPIPTGDAQGTAIFMPGTLVATAVGLLVRWFFWKGKVFSPATQDLRNKLSPFSVRGIRAMVYMGESWLDGRKVIVIDYSKTSFVAKKIRDEIRQVAPRVYLGKVWWGKKRIADFALKV